jgi:RNA polymerase-binding transcription factor DksA
VKKAAPAPAKSVAEVKKAAPAAKPAQTVKTAARPATAAQPVKTPTPAPRPAPREDKKPNVVVAHRRLEKKTKETEDAAGKTMINYQPDFTRSILDEQTQSGPVYRYSDEELVEFKDLILGRLESARKELTYLQGLITRKDEAGTEDTENRYMNMEDGSGAMEREQLAQLASRQIQFINHLEKALIRIENKTYGICRVTGKLIDKARLRAVPHATLSIDAKKMMSSK